MFKLDLMSKHSYSAIITTLETPRIYIEPILERDKYISFFDKDEDFYDNEIIESPLYLKSKIHISIPHDIDIEGKEEPYFLKKTGSFKFKFEDVLIQKTYDDIYNVEETDLILRKIPIHIISKSAILINQLKCIIIDSPINVNYDFITKINHFEPPIIDSLIHNFNTFYEKFKHKKLFNLVIMYNAFILLDDAYYFGLLVFIMRFIERPFSLRSFFEFVKEHRNIFATCKHRENKRLLEYYYRIIIGEVSIKTIDY